MRKDNITVKWKDEGKMYQKQIDRIVFSDLMIVLKEQFSDNNEISTKLVKLIPKIDSITINKDRNRDLDIPIISYKIGEKEDVISINRCHKIIWEIFNEMCKLP